MPARWKSHVDASLILVLVGLAWSARAALDSFRLEGAVGGPLLVLVACLWRRLRGLDLRLYAAAALLCVAYAASSTVLIGFRADSASYFAYLHSVAFDRDLEFGNEWAELGLSPEEPRSEAARKNVFSVGPAVLWSPFYAAAHAYVRLDGWIGPGSFEPDGYSLPYRRAPALGTVTVVVLGAILLGFMVADRAGASIALLSVTGAVFASPVLYYTFVVPAMSHGVTFGVAAAFLWAWHRARERPALSSWLVLGGLFGLLCMCRWQAAVYAALLVPLAVEGVWWKSVRPSWLAAGAVASVAAFGPQLLAWKIQFGEWLLIPQGRGFLDLSSPNWSRTLFSADHGLFTWTPLMLVGAAGLFAGIRKDPRLCGGGLVVLTATAWINGSVPPHDWAGGDAFGARRYTLVVPLLAVGLAFAVELCVRALRRAPILAPAAAVVLLSLWNLGFISHVRARKYPEMAPLERLAGDQARSLRFLARDVLGFVAGDRGRAFAYDFFSAEYFYTAFNRSGRIYLRSADDRYLMHGWHTPSRRIARRTFRRALYPEACVRIPLEEPFRLRVDVTARAPQGLRGQVMSVAVNGDVVSSSRLTREWRRVRFFVTKERLVAGENVMCLGFANALPEVKGRRVAAEVELIQLP